MDDRTVRDREEARHDRPVAADGAGTRPEEPIVETREEARQGETTAPMQRVLIGGIALVVTAFVIIYLVFFG